MDKDCDGNYPEIVIPKERALFWMDGQGRWHNQHGPFEHKKIIEHFNACIHKDQQGYYVGQNHNGVYEKVYFNYHETALFALDLIWENPVKMIINTGEQMALSPEMLFIRNDQLFHQKGDEIIMFSQNALTSISQKMEFSAKACSLRLHGKSYVIPER